MIAAVVITGYVVVGVLVSLSIEVWLRATRYRGPNEDDHAMAVASGIFWPLVGAGWLIYLAVLGIGHLAQAIADCIPTWGERIKGLREEWKR